MTSSRGVPFSQKSLGWHGENIPLHVVSLTLLLESYFRYVRIALLLRAIPGAVSPVIRWECGQIDHTEPGNSWFHFIHIIHEGFSDYGFQ